MLKTSPEKNTNQVCPSLNFGLVLFYLHCHSRPGHFFVHF